MDAQIEYVSPSPRSREGIYITEYLAAKLTELYPDAWKSLVEYYRFYGESLLPEHYIFKFKGNLEDIQEDDRYIEIPFSEAYKLNPEQESEPLSSEEWLAFLASKIASDRNSIWSLFYAQPES
jgi:hypothetical protein